MSYLNIQALFGAFALVTLILAGAAVGRVLGLGMSEALYAAALVTIGLVSAAYRFIGKRRGKD
jgi:membrane protein implicated in regulation of membrane protease activity